MTDRSTFGDRYRAGAHRAGLLWNRIVGTVLVVLGGSAALLSLASETFSLATHWPTFVAVAGLWWLARWFFKARDVVIEPTDGEGHPGETVLPLDRRLGTALARLFGTVALVGALAATWAVLTADDFSLARYWPVLGMSALLLLAARACLRTHAPLSDQLSETPRP